MSSPDRAPVASVVIPAHNEASVIRRCLESLRVDELDLDVVVAANACTDDTADVARQLTGVRVLETPVASKTAALNLADEATQTFPRIYLDADIELIEGALPALVTALTTEDPRVAAPHIRIETAHSSWAVRQFYAIFTRLSYARDGLVGLGVYGLSAAGRGRFDHFPEIQADDTFVQRLFTPMERRTVTGAFVVRAPQDLRSLLRVRTRVAAGNAALANDPTVPGDPAAFASTTGGTVGEVLRLLRARPARLPAALIYVGVSVLARLRARATTGSTWHRDESSR